MREVRRVSSQSHQNNFEPIPWSKVDCDRIDGCADRSLFQTRAWLEFLAEMQGAEPVVAVLRG